MNWKHQLCLSLAVLWAFGAKAAELDQFDLECTGKVLVTGEPWSAHLRMDLKAQEFCVDDCTSMGSVSEITPSSIKLAGPNALWGLDRGTGDVIFTPQGRYGAMGSCTKEKFTSFPRKF